MHKKLSISPAWVFRSEEGELFEPVTFQLLKGIQEHGKLTVAAKAAGVSYRHAWNLLNRAADFFSMPLVSMHKGQGTRLSPLGEKLLWSEQRVKARLGPQIDSMASELNSQVQQLLAGSHPVLRLHASHGYAVALLPDFSERLELNLQYCSPDNALSALARGDCDIASFHFPVCPRLVDEVMAHYDAFLQDLDLKVIRFVTRDQGLMQRYDSAKRLAGLKDLTDPAIRFINRDRHSGTRFLFNLLLREQGLSESQLNHADQEEFTHTAVAAYVAAGMADTGFGVEAAARQFNLDFINLVTEHYLLICREELLSQGRMHQLLALMRSADFIAAIDRLPGYAPDHCGEICTFSELLENDRQR